ncbi:hypothetical protein PG989_016403 [Apiospora arundinis]
MLRLKQRSGQYAWFQSAGSVRTDHGRRWVTLTLLEQHVSHLSSSTLSEAHERSTNHDIWVKLSTSGLILHTFGDPYVPLSLSANELVGTALQDLMKQCDAKTEFETQLISARYGGVMSSTVTLISRRGHRLETEHSSCNPPRRKQKALLSEHRSRPYSIARSVASIATNKAAPTSAMGNDGVNDDQDILGGLDPDRCGPLPYEIHQLKAANRALHNELQSLLKRAKQRRRYQRRGGDQALGCANCHTKVSPSGGAGPAGSATCATGAGCAGPSYAATQAARPRQQQPGELTERRDVVEVRDEHAEELGHGTAGGPLEPCQQTLLSEYSASSPHVTSAQASIDTGRPVDFRFQDIKGKRMNEY